MAITKYPTPLFNVPNIPECFGGGDGNSLPLDNLKLLRIVETILFPHSHIELLEKMPRSFIWRVRTDEYNYPGTFYVDERFLEHTDQPPRKPILPPISTILQRMNSLIGTPYIWGGNWPSGIDLLRQIYPSKSLFNQLDPLVKNTWILKGVDCTGLLYYATDGYTPRNSSSLVTFGKSVNSADLKDLDVIAWRGHIVIVDGNETIESRHPMGVVKTPLDQRLAEIQQQRPDFVIRRWHPMAQKK